MELAIANVTSFSAEALSFGQTNAAAASVLVRATCAWVEQGRLQSSEKQLPLIGADSNMGAAETTAVRYESDFVPYKPRADLLCAGKACAPRGLPVQECLVRFGVGTKLKTIRVFGNRRWVPGLGGLTYRMTEPEPFKSILVSFENAYGGMDPVKPDPHHAYWPNPIGKGYSPKGRGLENLALPNLEDPENPIRSWRDQPLPMSFGPVGRGWAPRFRRTGTYDKKWLKERSPNLPLDFDEGYYNCAPDDQQIKGYLRGDEEITVENMHPEHPLFRCRLPGVRVRSFVDRKASGVYRLEEITMNLDTLWVDMEALQVVLVWRGRFSMPKGVGKATVLVVDEPLLDSPKQPESYRPKLDERAAEEDESDRTIIEAEKELARLQLERDSPRKE
jgi:hypothetical protein